MALVKLVKVVRTLSPSAGFMITVHRQKRSIDRTLVHRQQRTIDRTLVHRHQRTIDRTLVHTDNRETIDSQFGFLWVYY